MYTRSKLVTIIILLLGIVPLAAVTVTGVVSDGTTDSPLPGANIVVENSQRGTISNSAGQFELALQAGSYTISVSYMGYEIAKKQVIVAAEDIEISFELTPLILAGQTVSVTANRALECQTRYSVE